MHSDTPHPSNGARRRADRPASPTGPASRATRPLLLGLAIASVFWLLAPRAEAACDPDTPPLANGGSVTCTGADETGFDASGFFVEDLGSTNGTLVNGSRITRQPLKSDDEIQMGKLRIGVTLPR